VYYQNKTCDEVWYLATDRKIFFIAVILITIGIIFSLSLTAYASLQNYNNEFHFFIRQFFTGVLAIFIIWTISQLDPDRYFLPLGFTLFFFFLVLMTLMPFLPSSIVTEIGGAKRWIRLGVISLAPVEFFKVGFITFLAWSFSRKLDDSHKSLKEEFKVFWPYFLVFGVVTYLIAIMQNDIGQVLVLGMVLIVMGSMAGTSTRFFTITMVGMILVVIVAIVGSEHRILRVKSWWSNIQNMVLSFLPDKLAAKLHVSEVYEPYQVSNAYNAIQNGGLFGQGLGNGTIKLGFLSEVHTDFILAGIAEELGIIGVLIIIALFFLLIFRMLKIANRSENRVYSLFALGIAVMFAATFFINSFGVTGITPVKGLAVPLLSYGGSSLLSHSIAIGMILMISKKVKY
jgi:cell division protein FtsW